MYKLASSEVTAAWELPGASPVRGFMEQPGVLVQLHVSTWVGVKRARSSPLREWAAVGWEHHRSCWGFRWVS